MQKQIRIILLLCLIGMISGCSNQDKEMELSSELTLENSEIIATKTIETVTASLASHDFVKAFIGNYPFSLMQLSFCMDGNVDQININDSERDLPGIEFIFDNCLIQSSFYNNQERIFNGSVSFSRNDEHDFLEITYGKFLLNQEETENDTFLTGSVSVKSLVDSSYESLTTLKFTDSLTNNITKELVAKFHYGDSGLSDLNWDGAIFIEGLGWFNLISSENHEIETIITDGKSSIYIDFTSLSDNNINVSLDLGNDGALDLIWSINLSNI